MSCSSGVAGTTQPDTIMLVEVCDELRRLMGAVLRRLGYSVIEAASGSEAVELAQRHPDPIDLLIADVTLTDVTGHAVAQQLATIRPGLAVLYISGYPREALADDALPQGSGFLQKPFERDALVLQVQEALRQKKPYRILFVDDDPILTRCAAQALSHAGFEVLTAENGRRAMAILAAQRVDLVVTDLVMPESEGLELIIALKKSKPLLPVVAISGALDRQFLPIAVKLGARDAFAKPLSIPKLLETVQRILRAGSTSAESENPSHERVNHDATLE